MNRSCFYYDFYTPFSPQGLQIIYQGAVTELDQTPNSLSSRSCENEASEIVVGEGVEIGHS